MDPHLLSPFAKARCDCKNGVDVFPMVMTKIKIKVVPGASGSGVSGWLGEYLKVRVSQPPEKGKANAAVEAVICNALHLPDGSAKIVSGLSSQRKTVEIHGLTSAQIHQRLANGNT
jgi:uncharacterized protein YggU (UPF0235/DUF167 family)